MFLSLSLAVCVAPPREAAAQQQQPSAFVKNKDIQAVKPKRPVSIKLKRSPQGQYSWDISGSSPDEVCRADSRLRRLLKTDQ
jgi:hypothetical protein